MEPKNRNKKLSTRIHGLDNLFHGGLHLEEIGDKAPNLMIVIRGEHGTNKIHLAMQMCEGLNDSINKENQSANEKVVGEQGSDGQFSSNKKMVKNDGMLFVSLNKDDEKVREFYFDFYVKRLIRNIQVKAEGWKSKKDADEGDIQKIRGLFNLAKFDNNGKGKGKKLELPPQLSCLVDFLSKGGTYKLDKIQDILASDVLYYNTRTHGLHIRQQTKNDDSNDTQLLKINLKSKKLPKIEFWGRTKLSNKNEMADNRTIFYNLVQKLEKEESKHYNCIMIDGLSLLTAEESEDCPINALIGLLRKKCTIGILNTNNNQPVSRFDSDVIIDLRNRVDDVTNHTKKELCIYKCLYQKNAYGWHQYKMRNAGVEVIPSLHKTLSRRNYMDESVAEAVLPLNKLSYSYWLSENNISKCLDQQGKSHTEIVTSLAEPYKEFYKTKNNKKQYDDISQGQLCALLSSSNPKEAIYDAINKINDKDHILFIDLKRSRKDFWSFIGKELDSKGRSYEKLHYFGFRAGCIYADEFLYIIEQQVAAIAREIMEKDDSNGKKKQVFHYYKQVHIVMGDLVLLQYCYPCLYSEQLFIPTFSALTKGNYMTNYIYMTNNDDTEGSKRIRQQLAAIADDVI